MLVVDVGSGTFGNMVVVVLGLIVLLMYCMCYAGRDVGDDSCGGGRSEGNGACRYVIVWMETTLEVEVVLVVLFMLKVALVVVVVSGGSVHAIMLADVKVGVVALVVEAAVVQ